MGFFICIESLKHLYTLVEGQRLQFIATYRLSQDHIEMLFGAIRRHGGYNNNPNVIQFKGIFKKILQHLEMKSSFLGNCLPLEDITVLTCSSAVHNINSTVSIRNMDEEIDSIENDSQLVNATAVENDINTNVEVFSTMLNQEGVKKTTEQIVGYISGWVSRKLASVLKCTDSLYCNNKLWFHKMIILKNMGGLCFASEDVFRICLKSESIIKNHIKEMGHIILPDHKDYQIKKKKTIL